MTLYQHQKDILEADPKKAGLFLGTGSGKTRIALMLACGRTLVIAPKTQVLDKNWEREMEKLLEDQFGIVLPRVVNMTDVKLTVISKETFRRDAHKLPHFDTVIVDEAHTCLGVTPNIKWRKKVPSPRTSQLFEELDKYLKRTEPDRFYLVTATVIRSPMSVWGAARLLGHHFDWYAFRDMFYVRLPMPGREVWAPKSDSDSKEKLARIVRKIGYTGRLEDFFDVPQQTFKTDYIELTAEQKKRIKELKLEYPEPIVRVGKIHQVENGVLAGDEFNEAESFDNAKIEKILDYAVEFPRMVIFAKYTQQIAQIADALAKAGYSYGILNGQTHDRGEAIRQANAKKDYIFICQAQISAGWELPDYPVMIFASRTYSFVDYDQALGRIQRANNIKKNLYINLVVKGGVDEAVDKCLINKSDFNERIYTGV